MGLLYRLTGCFPSDQEEFLDGVVKDREVTITINPCVIEVSQSALFSFSKSYSPDGKFVFALDHPSGEVVPHPKQLYDEVMELKASLDEMSVPYVLRAPVIGGYEEIKPNP